MPGDIRGASNDTQYSALSCEIRQQQAPGYPPSIDAIRPDCSRELEEFRHGAGAHRAYMRILHSLCYQPASSTLHRAHRLDASHGTEGRLLCWRWTRRRWKDLRCTVCFLTRVHQILTSGLLVLRLYSARFECTIYSPDPTRFARTVSRYVYDNMPSVTLL